MHEANENLLPGIETYIKNLNLNLPPKENIGWFINVILWKQLVTRLTNSSCVSK